MTVLVATMCVIAVAGWLVALAGYFRLRRLEEIVSPIAYDDPSVAPVGKVREELLDYFAWEVPRGR